MDLQNYTYNKNEEADSSTLLKRIISTDTLDSYFGLYVRQFDSPFSQYGTVDLLIAKGAPMNNTYAWVISIVPDDDAPQCTVQEGREDDALPSINDPAVLAYLAKYPDIRTAIDGSMVVLPQKSFCTDAVLSIEVFSEPDEDDEYLSLYVRQEEYQDDILDRIDVIRAQMRGSLAANKGRVLLTTDFQPPH